VPGVIQAPIPLSSTEAPYGKSIESSWVWESSLGTMGRGKGRDANNVFKISFPFLVLAARFHFFPLPVARQRPLRRRELQSSEPVVEFLLPGGR